MSVDDQRLPEVLKMIREQLARYRGTNKVIVEHWVDKLSEPQHHVAWRRNALLYALYLLDMLSRHEIEEPFSRRPPDGPLPTIPSHLKNRYSRLSNTILTSGYRQPSASMSVERSQSLRKSLESSTHQYNLPQGQGKQRPSSAAAAPDPVKALVRRIYTMDGEDQLESSLPNITIPSSTPSMSGTALYMPAVPLRPADKENKELASAHERIRELEAELAKTQQELALLREAVLAMNAEDDEFEANATRICTAILATCKD